MTTETIQNPDGNFDKNANEEQNVADLMPSLSLNEGSNKMADTSPKHENSPTKSKNKRRNEAKKRATNAKKQMIFSDSSEKKQEQDCTSPTPLKEQTSPQKPKDNEEQNPRDNSQLQAGNNPISIKNPDQTSRFKQSELSREKARIQYEVKEQLKTQNVQIQGLVEQVKHQMNKIKELESALNSTTKTCNHFERLLQQELVSRGRLEAENDNLSQSITRLKTQLSVHEKNKFNSDELLRVYKATLMEMETEISILKLKLTRIQTNPSTATAINSASSVTSIKPEPCQVFASSGRSNSEFDRNSYLRSSLAAELACNRSSTTQLRATDRDASIWAKVPEELTPSRRPQLVEKSFQPLYGDSQYNLYGNIQSQASNTSSPLTRDRRYRTLPRSMKSPSQEFSQITKPDISEGNQNGLLATSNSNCQVTNLDDSASTNQSSENKTLNSSGTTEQRSQLEDKKGNIFSASNNKSNPDVAISSEPSRQPDFIKAKSGATESTHYSTISKDSDRSKNDLVQGSFERSPPKLPERSSTTPTKFSNGLKRIFDKFRRTDSSTNSQSKTDLDSYIDTPRSSPFKRGANRATLVDPSNARTNRNAVNFQTDKPFAEWDTDMLVNWLTMIGLSMYSNNCRRWVKCGAHIMNATPAEVDKGLGITNHLHRKKLRLAISELNGDCDKVTKAAAKLDYLWVARWLDDLGLPQYKEVFINARVDGRVLNYLTVEDLVSMGIKSLLHHASIRCGIKVLRSVNFDLQQLKRRATSEEVEHMNLMRQQINQAPGESNSLQFGSSEGAINEEQSEVALWTCHRVMEWLRLIDFAEFAPNLRGSGVHGGLIMFEDGFNIDTICSLLSIPTGRTLLRRHLSTFFSLLIGNDLSQRKLQHQDLFSKHQLTASAEIRSSKKSPLWFSKLKSSKVSQDGMDEYLCPMYPVEPQIIKSPLHKTEVSRVREESQLPDIPESINV